VGHGPWAMGQGGARSTQCLVRDFTNAYRSVEALRAARRLGLVDKGWLNDTAIRSIARSLRDWQMPQVRLFAPHRFLRCMGDCFAWGRSFA
jgi:hypothetical protein